LCIYFDKEAPYRLKFDLWGLLLLLPRFDSSLVDSYFHPLFPGGWLAVAASRGAVTLDSSWD
jgi:hypothetical protein